jgi:hypothetical protein
MSKWEGWVIEKRYYKVAVFADDWEEARNKVVEIDVAGTPDDFDWEIYDLVEVKDGI